jgi:DNA polymerase-3 subunit epsilon
MLPRLRSILSIQEKHPLIVQNEEYFAAFNQAVTLAECSFVVFDTELTGLNKRKDEIIAIGAVRINNLRIILKDTFYSFVKPKNLEPSQSTLVHRITPEQLRQAPELHEVLPRFVEFVNRSLLVGHFIGIDMAFLNRAVQSVMGGSLSNPCIDTMRMARGYKEARLVHSYGNYEQTESYRLEDLSKEFNLPRFKPHDAFEDALQAAYLFLYLLQKLQRGGVKTLKQMYRAGRSAWLV